ncbi:MAG: rhomboid family intramembrane serine protease [Actinomycetota bacterium]|nr:rhomboid family intramembrane serine protease [Actinomycetota bacterium]
MVIPLRDENPTETFPWITVGLIAANIFIFLYEISLSATGQLELFVYAYSLIPYEITHGMALYPATFKLPYLAILTSMFLHGGWVHVIGNMLYLWIFGNNIEDALGHFRFLFFYLLCGLGGTLGHILSGPNSQVPSLGASGAIAGVLAAYLVFYPGARILAIVPFFYFIQIVKLPATLVIGFWFIVQLMSGVASLGVQTTGGVAWFAHIGGFLAGFILVLILPKRKRSRRITGNYF